MPLQTGDSVSTGRRAWRDGPTRASSITKKGKLSFVSERCAWGCVCVLSLLCNWRGTFRMWARMLIRIVFFFAVVVVCALAFQHPPPNHRWVRQRVLRIRVQKSGDSGGWGGGKINNKITLPLSHSSPGKSLAYTTVFGQNPSVEFHRGIALPACAHTLSLAVLWIDAVRDGPSQNPRQRPSTVGRGQRMPKQHVWVEVRFAQNLPRLHTIRIIRMASKLNSWEIFHRRGFMYSPFCLCYTFFISPSSFLHAAYFSHPTESEMKVKPRPRDVKWREIKFTTVHPTVSSYPP